MLYTLRIGYWNIKLSLCLFFHSSLFLLHAFKVLLMGTCTFLIVLFSWCIDSVWNVSLQVFVLKSILFDISKATANFLRLLFSWSITIKYCCWSYHYNTWCNFLLIFVILKLFLNRLICKLFPNKKAINSLISFVHLLVQCWLLIINNPSKATGYQNKLFLKKIIQ